MDLEKLLGNRSFYAVENDLGAIVSENCRGYPMQVGCEHCRAAIDLVLWVIVDCDHRPDLRTEAKLGTLHDPKCPECGQRTHLAADLLLLRRRRDPVLIFSPDPATTDEEDHFRTFYSFARKLQSQMGSEFRPAWAWNASGKLVMPRLDRSRLQLALQWDDDNP